MAFYMEHLSEEWTTVLCAPPPPCSVFFGFMVCGQSPCRKGGRPVCCGNRQQKPGMHKVSLSFWLWHLLCNFNILLTIIFDSFQGFYEIYEYKAIKLWLLCVLLCCALQCLWKTFYCFVFCFSVTLVVTVKGKYPVINVKFT